MVYKKFFIGGARCGKSALAQKFIENLGEKRLYIATCRVEDHEMAKRVEKHKQMRGIGWDLVEEDVDPVKCILAAKNYDGILFDCVSLWVSNLLCDGKNEKFIIDSANKFANILNEISISIAIVSLEVGLGIVPENALSRKYRDILGMVNQILASSCIDAYFVTSGLPILLKGQPLENTLC